MVQPTVGDRIRRAQRQQPRRRGVARYSSKDEASSGRVRRRDGPPTSAGGANEVSSRKLRNILRQAETKQTVDWVQTQHKALDHELYLAAARFERDKLHRKPMPSPPRPQPAGLTPSASIDDRVGLDGLANTWPSTGFSTMKVDGQRLILSRRARTPPSKVIQSAQVSRGNEGKDPRKGSATEGFVNRMQAAMERRGIDANVLKGFLVPPSAIDPKGECNTVRTWEVFKVLALDLDLKVSEGDKQLISTRFGDGEDGGKVDVRALLAAVDPNQAAEHPADGSALPTSGTIASGGQTPWKDCSQPIFSTRSGKGVRASLGGEGSSPEVSNVMPTRGKIGGSSSTSKDDAFEVLLEPSTAEIPTSDALGSPPAYQDVVKGPGGFEPRLIPDEVGDEGSDNGSSGGGKDDAVDAAVAVANAALEEENARLRSELAVFDLGFFEEVEDLKYSYTSLKREADKLAAKDQQRQRRGAPTGLSSGLDHLDLPEEGQEPWDRSVDMAHHSVDWAASMARSGRGSSPRGKHAARLAKRWESLSLPATPGEPERTQGFPTGSPFPVRGRGWARRDTDEALGSDGEGWGVASPGWRRREGASPSKAAAATAPATRVSNGVGSGMLVAAHERKLAWELSCGGMGSLVHLREHVRRLLDRSGGNGYGGHGGANGGDDCFGSDEEVLSALQHSGYDSLELEDVGVLRSGLGSSADWRVDLVEFMGMCEDIASGHEWYLPPPSAALGQAGAGAAATRRPTEEFTKAGRTATADLVSGGPFSLPDSLFLEKEGWGWEPSDNGTGGAGVGGDGKGKKDDWLSTRGGGTVTPREIRGASHDSLFMGGTVFGEKSFLESSTITAESVLAEVKDQLSLLDLDHLLPPSDEFPTPASTQDPSMTGSGSAGRTLGQAISARFSRRDLAQTGLLSAREVGLALEDIGVRLKEDEVIALVGKFQPPGGSPQQRSYRGGPWATKNRVRADDQYAPLVRVVVGYLAEAAGIDPAVGGRARLARKALKWNERMPAPAKRLRAVLTAREGGGGGVKRLRQRFEDFDLDGDGCLGKREFMRALNLALACETGEATESPCPSPGDGGGSTSVVGGLLSDQEASDLMDRLDRHRDGRVCWEAFADSPAETWFQREGDIAEKLLQHVELQGGATERRAWVNSLSRRLRTADVHHTGALDRDEFCRCLRGMRVSLSTREGERLFLSLLPTAPDAVGANYSELVEFLRSNNARWYDVEKAIADKILAAMGPDSASRRAWLNRLRRRFMSLDAFRVGVLGASDLLQALRDAGCYLCLEEEARLLDALETEESARFDTEGGVSYRELLLFCAKHAGKWSDAEPALAERLREALRGQAKTAADVRRLFRRLDDDNDGFIGRKDFKIALHRLGLGFVTRGEQEMLMDDLDAEGSGRVRYADFASFFLDADPWFRTNADLAERLCQSLGSSGGDGDGGGSSPGEVLGTLRERFVAADRGKQGFLNGSQFRAILESLPGTRDFTEEEVERLTTLLDEDGDGRVSYRSLLSMLTRHLGDWAKRLPQVAAELSGALQQTQYGLKACVGNLGRRLDIADHESTGRLPPSTIGRCLRSVGIVIAPKSLNEMAAVMDAHGDGLIPTAPVLEFLQKEAGITTTPPSPQATEVAGKVGAAFRTAVRSLAETEQEWARRGSDSDTSGPEDCGGWDQNRRDYRGYAHLASNDPRSGGARRGVSKRDSDAVARGEAARWRNGSTRLNATPAGTGRESGGGGRSEAWRAPGRTLHWSECLRRVFDRRLDIDGDGFLTEGDLVSCLPEIGVDVHDASGAARALLAAMDRRERGLGQATFKDFVGFMGADDGSNHRRSSSCGRGGARSFETAPRRSSLSPRRRHVRRVRLALGLPTSPRTTAPETSNRFADRDVTRKDLQQALIRLDPKRSGRLPLGKVKAALQGLGLAVGKVPWASWLDLTGSLDQDAHGHLFYSDFVDLLMPPEPSNLGSPPKKSDPGKGNRDARRWERSPLRSPQRTDDRGGQRAESSHSNGEANSAVAKGDDHLRRKRGLIGGAAAKARMKGVSRKKDDACALKTKKRSTRRPPMAVQALLDRILDGVFDEHGGVTEGGRALRSALQRQDLTNSGWLSQGELRLALESAGAPLTSREVETIFGYFDKRSSGMMDYGRFADHQTNWPSNKGAAVIEHSQSQRHHTKRASCRPPNCARNDEAPALDLIGDVAASTRRAIRTQRLAVEAMRRRLEDDITEKRRTLIGGVEFKRLLRSSGLELAPVEISHLRQKCSDISSGQASWIAHFSNLAAQIDTLALLAYFGPPERSESNSEGGLRFDGRNDDILPDDVLKGSALPRHERPRSAAVAGLGGSQAEAAQVVGGKAERRARIAAALRR
ncbi:unnamed protein product [Scytosiphon promiscuus]